MAIAPALALRKSSTGKTLEHFQKIIYIYIHLFINAYKSLDLREKKFSEWFFPSVVQERTKGKGKETLLYFRMNYYVYFINWIYTNLMDWRFIQRSDPGTFTFFLKSLSFSFLQELINIFSATKRNRSDFFLMVFMLTNQVDWRIILCSNPSTSTFF